MVCGLATTGWRLTGEKIAELKVQASNLGPDDTMVLYGLDNSSFVTTDADMQSGPPFRGRDGRFHAHGRLDVISGYSLDRLLDMLEELMVACQGKLLLIVAPMPRYWLPCYDKMEVSLPTAADQDKRDLGNLRRAIIGRVMKLKASRWVHLFNPLEALNLGDCVADIEQVMKDSCHLLPACYRVLAEDLVRCWEESRASKRAAEMSTEGKSKAARTYKAAPRRGY